MQIRINPLGKLVNEFLMKWALPLGLFFIVEYWVRNASATNVLLGLFTFPMMLVTPVALWWLLRKLRRTVLSDMMLGIQAWSFGVQLMFFAGLIESLFIYVYNQFLFPANLYEVYAMFQSLGTMQAYLPTLQQAIDLLKEAPVSSAIETAITSWANEIFIGMILMVPIAFIVRKRPQ